MNAMRYSWSVSLFIVVVALVQGCGEDEAEMPEFRTPEHLLVWSYDDTPEEIRQKIRELDANLVGVSLQSGRGIPEWATTTRHDIVSLEQRLAELEDRRMPRTPIELMHTDATDRSSSTVIYFDRDRSEVVHIGPSSYRQEIDNAIAELQNQIDLTGAASVQPDPILGRQEYRIRIEHLEMRLALLEALQEDAKTQPSKMPFFGFGLVIVGVVILLAVYYFKFYKAPLKLPEGAKRFCPPGTPAWPLIYRLPNGSAIVIGKHPTISSLKMSDGLIGGGWLIGFLLMSCMCCSGIAQTEEENAEPSNQRAFITIALIAAAVAGTGTVLGLSIRNKTTRIDLDKEKLLINGKVWKRLPGVDIVFRIKPLDHINEKLDREKNKQMRMSLVNARQVQMIYGMQTVQIVVILSTPSSEQFAAVCSLADQLVVNLPASEAPKSVQSSAKLGSPPLAGGDDLLE